MRRRSNTISRTQISPLIPENCDSVFDSVNLETDSDQSPLKRSLTVSSEVYKTGREETQTFHLASSDEKMLTLLESVSEFKENG